MSDKLYITYLFVDLVFLDIELVKSDISELYTFDGELGQVRSYNYCGLPFLF